MQDRETATIVSVRSAIYTRNVGAYVCMYVCPFSSLGQ